VIIILKKKIFFPILALAIIGTAVATSSFVNAQDSTGPNSLVAAIAAKFNLNQADVQAVFNEEREKHHVEMKAQMEQKLTQAVIDGKITEAQKQAIINHFGEMKAKKIEKGQLGQMSDEQIKAFKESKKAEMDSWLSQNGLTHELLQEVMGHPKGFGGKHFVIRGQ
jgi:phospholipase C